VFGFSFGELVVLVIVAVVVIGPKDMPKVLRKLGQGAGKLRRMASDIRRQSGIDDVLRGEGIADDINEIRKLARGEMENVTRAVRTAPPGAQPAGLAPGASSANEDIVVQRDREYPTEGADAYRALPDTALVYAGTLPVSPLARDPLYVTGDPDGVVPEPPAAPATQADAPPGEPEPEPAPHDA
jgi:sec-independent protein translocase protein TatB